MGDGKEYLVPTGAGEAEYVEKRSRFIGRVIPISTEQEALDMIRRIREKHWDATHNVYAYSLRENGIARYSDDGEPQGTAGMPVFEVFRREGIFDYCCVVTRYFGGTLLGAGGLVRAYAHTARLALEAAGISEMRLWTEFEIRIPYNFIEKTKTEIGRFDGALESAEYGEEVFMRAMIPKESGADFVESLGDATSGSARIRAADSRFKAKSAIKNNK